MICNQSLTAAEQAVLHRIVLRTIFWVVTMEQEGLVMCFSRPSFTVLEYGTRVATCTAVHADHSVENYSAAWYQYDTRIDDCTFPLSTFADQNEGRE